MKKLLLATAIVALSTGSAFASCSTYIGSGTCTTNSDGSRSITNQNLNGGYTTNTDGYQTGTTSQNLNGSWTTRNNDGSSSTSTTDPYGGSEEKDPYNPYGLTN